MVSASVLRRYYLASLLTSVFAVVSGFLWNGMQGAVDVFILTVVEVSLSFDNAVVNAAILANWSPKWRDRFITWGLPIAVFGMRFVLPLGIVAITGGTSLLGAVDLALNNPEMYSILLGSVHWAISSFGLTFLSIIAMKFFIDEEKDEHWVAFIEAPLAKLGVYIKSWVTYCLIALLIAATSVQFLPTEVRTEVLLASLAGAVTYAVIQLLQHLVADAGTSNLAVKFVKEGFVGILYLEVLDASFSVDGVVAALAITNQIVIIMLGLGAGAMFVRSMTIHLVDSGTMAKFKYLEHSAFAAIGFLAATMYAGMFMHVPEALTGAVSFSLLAVGVWTSHIHNKRHPEDATL